MTTIFVNKFTVDRARGMDRVIHSSSKDCVLNFVLRMGTIVTFDSYLSGNIGAIVASHCYRCEEITNQCCGAGAGAARSQNFWPELEPEPEF